MTGPHRIPQNNRAGKPGELGRHVNHDPRSRAFAHAPSSETLRSRVWKRHFVPLDQGPIGSCTGNAMLGAVYTGKCYDALTPAACKQVPPTEENARDLLYAWATKLDAFVGSYPPVDTGSDGVSVAKAAQKLGLIAGYRHTFSLDDALRTLANDSHVIVGLNWYHAFDRPDTTGLVTLPARIGMPEGGHEFLIYGIDVLRERVLARNSWGPYWGGGLEPGSLVGPGEFQFTFQDFGRLLREDGDVTVPVPLTAPKPAAAGSHAESLFEKALRWLKAHA